jgi:hypothetical protein
MYVICVCVCVCCVFVFPSSSRRAIFAEIVFWAHFPGPIPRTISACRTILTYYSPWLPFVEFNWPGVLPSSALNRFQVMELCNIGLYPIDFVGRDSVVGIAMHYGLDGPGIESRWGEIFRTCPDRPWGPPSLPCNGYRVFPGGKAAGPWR